MRLSASQTLARGHKLWPLKCCSHTHRSKPTLQCKHGLYIRTWRLFIRSKYNNTVTWSPPSKLKRASFFFPVYFFRCTLRTWIPNVRFEGVTHSRWCSSSQYLNAAQAPPVTAISQAIKHYGGGVAGRITSTFWDAYVFLFKECLA